VHGAARHVDRLAGAELTLVAVHLHAQRALEHLEMLVLAGVEVLRRRRAFGAPGGLDLEAVGALITDGDGFVRRELERVHDNLLV
jgi:hypothetical protein